MPIGQSEEKKDLHELKLKIKKYLELENVSVLAGAGASFHLGTPTIRKISDCGDLKESLNNEISKYFEPENDPSYEDLFNCLQAEKFLKEKKKEETQDIQKSILEMQQWLFDHCNTETSTLNELYNTDENLLENKYYYHEMLIKKLLQRPNNLKRVNLFTTNYDLAFDYALDNLGVYYINGFSGIHNRFFKPEVYDYDIYYPGQSVSGQVHRAEKVIRYFKLHGSLSWISTKETIANPYGIKEIPINNEKKLNCEDQLMIYPCVSKKTFTLDLPYSELFRDFSKSIIQPQTVLFTLGYSFYDEHINDIIFQALSIPSFTLIIANFAPKREGENENPVIEKLKKLNDSRIIILDSDNEKETTFTGFVKNVLPDLYEEDEYISLKKTMNSLYSNSNNDEVENATE